MYPRPLNFVDSNIIRMGDDLDDLLDEIEGSLAYTETTKPSLNVKLPIKT